MRKTPIVLTTVLVSVFASALVSRPTPTVATADAGPPPEANSGPLESAAHELPVLSGPEAESCYGFTTLAGGQISGFGGYCGVPLNPPDAAPGGPPCHAAVARPALQAVIRDTCAWESLWAEHSSITYPAPPAPEVDFERFVVVVLVAGPRPNGCYGAAITRITGGADGRTIHVVEGLPCEGDHCTMVVTNPYHFIRVCRKFLPPETPICFENRYSEDSCGILALCPDETPLMADEDTP